MTFAIIFNDVGVGEWFVLLAVVLIVMGPKRLPETARTVGRYYSKLRRAADSFKRQLMDMDTEIDKVVSEAEREASEAFTVDDSSGAPASQPDAQADYAHGGYPGDYDGPESYDYGADGHSEPGTDESPAAETAMEKPAAEKPAVDKTAIKVTVSPAPGAAAGQKA